MCWIPACAGMTTLPTRTGTRCFRIPARANTSQMAPASSLRVCLLIRNAGNRAFLGAHGWPGQGFDHLLGAFRIGDPLLVEVVRASGHALVALTRVDLARVAAMQQLEQMVL